MYIQDMKLTKAKAGKLVDDVEVKITKCQLGCFLVMWHIRPLLYNEGPTVSMREDTVWPALPKGKENDD